jgi:ferric-dicitrate binding protein FerR (iron transport regulator)
MTFITREKLVQFFQGEVSPEQRAEILQWLADKNADHTLLQEFMQDQWDGTEEIVETAADERMLAAFQQKLYPTGAASPRTKLRLLPGRWIGYAAAAVVTAVLALTAVITYRNLNTAGTMAATVPMQQTQTGKGQVKAVKLPDGSAVWLNAASRLQYPARFDGAQREVYLEGEAFFDIAQQAAQPFIVHSGNLNTTVLGTSFNIKAFAALAQVQVTVVTGKVGVAAKGDSMQVVRPNEQVCYHTATGQFSRQEVVAAHAFAWCNKTIHLDGVSFKELALTIKNTWGLSLQAGSNKLTQASYKTTFRMTDSIENVMKAVSRIANAKYSIRDSVITMYE